MSIRRVVRTALVDRLPRKYRFMIERAYLCRCVSNYIETEVKVMKQLCHASKNSLDIGANQGVFTLFLSAFSSHVYGFEPLPDLCEQLSEKFNKCNVTIANCALGSTTGEEYINVPSVGGKRLNTRSSLCIDFKDAIVMGQAVTGVERVKVQLKRLDDFHIDNVGFIKIDVEGFEVETLKGARETIKRNMPNMFIEIEQKHHRSMKIEDIFKFVLDLSYYGYFVHDGKLKVIDEFDLDSMQDEADDTRGRYINNFIFTTSPLPGLKI